MVRQAPERLGEDGQTMTEYAVILGVITPAIVLALALLSDAVRARIETVIAFFG
jgi:Flp pilus assembly pilin Flp